MASQAARAGVPDLKIQLITGDADIRTVKKYFNREGLRTQKVIFEKINTVVYIEKAKGSH